VKEFKRYKRQHKPAWKKAATAAEGAASGSKVDLEDGEGDDEEDEMELRVKRIKKQLDEVISRALPVTCREKTTRALLIHPPLRPPRRMPLSPSLARQRSRRRRWPPRRRGPGRNY